jgi:spore coat protein A
MAPAERADLIVDFSAYAGQTLVLYNDAPAPFPGGDPLNDYFNTGAAGPNTRVLMQLVVGAPGSATNPQDQPLRSELQAGSNLAALPAAINGDTWNEPLIWLLTKHSIADITPGVSTTLTGHVINRIRQLTLNESFDSYGRLTQMVGTNVPTSSGSYGRAYMDAPTEVTNNGAVEIWQIYNTTADVHPMHFHLFNVQIISRQLFKYVGGKFVTMGPLIGADANETGWKETVRMYPGTVTTIIMPIKLPNGTLPFTVPVSPRTGGNEYVWHCHILEHEEHDMMRPLVVNGATVPIK